MGSHNYLVKNGIMQSDFLIFKGRLLTAAQKSSFLLLRKAVTSGTTTSPQSRGSAAQSFQAVHFSRRAASRGRVMASGSRAALALGRGNGACGYKPPSQGPATAPEAAPPPAAFPSRLCCRGRSGAAMRGQHRCVPRACAAGGQDGGSHGAELLGRRLGAAVPSSGVSDRHGNGGGRHQLREEGNREGGTVPRAARRPGGCAGLLPPGRRRRHRGAP